MCYGIYLLVPKKDRGVVYHPNYKRLIPGRLLAFCLPFASGKALIVGFDNIVGQVNIAFPI